MRVIFSCSDILLQKSQFLSTRNRIFLETIAKKSHVYLMDLASYESCDTLIDKITDNFGKMSLLIKSAGITDDSYF